MPYPIAHAVISRSGPLSMITGRAPLLAIGMLLGLLLPAHGQIDTTETARPDTTRPPPTDTTNQQPLRPQSFAPLVFGRPQTDSLPGRRPHVSVGLMLAEQPGSFLYDFGFAGWPHGWSPRGLAPHRVQLWLDGRSFNDPLTGRARFELLPPSFLDRPRVGVDPGGGAVGVHTSWCDYASERPVTTLRYRRNSTGLHAVEAAHSQKRRVDLFGNRGVLQVTFGYGGRKAEGVYAGSDLRRERRVWGRLRYQTADWVVELSDQSSRYRIGAHGGVQPPRSSFESIYILPLAAQSVENPNAQRQTFRNDLTARIRAPLLPEWSSPTEISVTWTSNTFDFRTGGQRQDTTWTAKLNGGQARVRQSMEMGPHTLTVGARGALWGVAQSNVPQIDGIRKAAHVFLRDSLRVGATDLVLDGGGHFTSGQWFPSAVLRATRRADPFRVSASVRATGQRGSWVEDEGFANLVRPLRTDRTGITDRLLEVTATVGTELGPVDAQIQGFAHQLRNAVDLYAEVPGDNASLSTITDTVLARQTETPVRRVGATLSFGFRRDARRGVYATGHGTLLKTLDAQGSPLRNRLAQTHPLTYGRARIGARFLLFTDLITDLYVQARGWSAMNSRWFHPPTGRLVVPPREDPIPEAPGQAVGPSGTIDLHAEAQFRGATLFFSYENVQAGTQLQPGTFVVPVYPLPAQQFRFGVFWPIFN